MGSALFPSTEVLGGEGEERLLSVPVLLENMSRSSVLQGQPGFPQANCSRVLDQSRAEVGVVPLSVP